MKKIRAGLIAAAVAAALITGCMTTDPTTGVKAYDPVKTETVKAALSPIVSGSITLALSNNPEKKEQIGTYLRAVGNVFCNMHVSGDFTPSFLLREVDRLTAELQATAPPLVLVAKQSVLGLYEAFYAQRLRAELPPDKWPAHVAELFCKSIDTGLRDGGVAGLQTAP